MALNYPFFPGCCTFKKCRKENMKTYCLLKQIISKSEVEKHFPFPDWLATNVGFLKLYMPTKNDKCIGKGKGKMKE